MQGTYALVITIPHPLRLQVGRLGDIVFPEGYWLYFGSALNGLEARLRRHLRHDKKLHWHVDYLTGRHLSGPPGKGRWEDRTFGCPPAAGRLCRRRREGQLLAGCPRGH